MTEEQSTTDVVRLDINAILKQLPHRYPFLLVDRVLECHKGKSIRAIKNVTYNEPFFTGHPGAPVLRHGATYAGHPACCVAAMVNLDILERENLVPRGRELEGVLMDALRPLADHDAVKEVRGGTGLAAAVELHPDVIAAVPGAVGRFTHAVQEAGVLVRAQATGVAIGPPLVVEREHLDEIAPALRHGLVVVAGVAA